MSRTAVPVIRSRRRASSGTRRASSGTRAAGGGRPSTSRQTYLAEALEHGLTTDEAIRTLDAFAAEFPEMTEPVRGDPAGRGRGGPRYLGQPPDQAPHRPLHQVQGLRVAGLRAAVGVGHRAVPGIAGCAAGQVRVE